jgi:hypothetical protein
VADLARQSTAAIDASGKTRTQIAKEAHTTEEKSVVPSAVKNPLIRRSPP